MKVFTSQIPASPLSRLGYEPMDCVHDEFHFFVAGAQNCSDAELPTCLDLLVTHLQAHFAAEESWMRDTDYPASDCHIAEHRAVLQSAVEVVAAQGTGKTALSRAFVNELARWFPAHADYLDSALAHWICKSKFGGKPIVLHRRRPDTEHPPFAETGRPRSADAMPA